MRDCSCDPLLRQELKQQSASKSPYVEHLHSPGSRAMKNTNLTGGRGTVVPEFLGGLEKGTIWWKEQDEAGYRLVDSWGKTLAQEFLGGILDNRTTSTTLSTNWGTQTSSTTSTWYEVPLTRKEVKKALMLLRRLPPLPVVQSPPLRRHRLEGARNGFQQMCRLPNYRGVRAR